MTSGGKSIVPDLFLVYDNRVSGTAEAIERHVPRFINSEEECAHRTESIDMTKVNERRRESQRRSARWSGEFCGSYVWFRRWTPHFGGVAPSGEQGAVSETSCPH